MEGQVPIVTQGRDRIVPPDAEYIHGDVQDRVDRDEPAHDPTSTIVTQCFKIPWLVC